jgi:VWFA-related protein
VKLLRLCRPAFFIIALLASAGAQQAAPAQATTAPANAQPTVTIKSESRLVVVDVVVTDSHGQPVQNLTRDDFTLLEDGKPQQMKVFENHATPTSKTDTAAGPAKAKTNSTPAQQHSGPLNIVLLDALNTETQDQTRVHQHMIDLLKTLPPGPRVAVFTLTDRLKQLQNFTSDRDALLATANKVVPSRSTISDENKRDDQEFVAFLAKSGAPASMVANMRQFVAETAANNADQRVQITLQALRQIGQSVKGYPGRKNLLWISGNLPFSIFADNSLKDPSTVIRNYSKAIKDTAVILSEAQIAVYAIDPVGVSWLQPDATYGNTLLRYGYGVEQLSDDMRKQSDSAHASMMELASATGGHAFFNHNDIKLALERSLALGSSYYTVAYAPTNHDFDGKLRHIVVKVPRKDAHLAYRREYYAARQGEGLSDADKERDLMVALNPDSPELTGLHLKASLTTPDDKGKTKVRYTLVPGQFAVADGAESALNLAFVAVGWNGKGEDLGHSMLNVRVPNGKDIAKQLAERPVVVDQEVEVKPGVTFFRVGVLDRNTGRMATLQANLPPSYIATHNAQQASKK